MDQLCRLPVWAAYISVAIGCVGAGALVLAAPPCTDAVLAAAALDLSTGPAPGASRLGFPGCVPSKGQLLALQQPWETPNTLPAALLKVGNGTAALAGLPRTAEVGGQGPPVLHLYVVTSGADWCSSPCQGPTWELAAPKPSAGSPYALLEVAIWRQERRVALYRFDEGWLLKAKKSYYELCQGTGWACPAYRAWREDRRLAEVGPWPQALDSDAAGLSRFLRDAFVTLADRARQDVPELQQLVLTYGGHGARADGSLFEGSIAREDSAVLMRHLAGISPQGQLSLLNFGTNCEEGRWNMLAALHPFAQWILASDLKVGGFEMTQEESKSAAIKKLAQLGDMAVLKASIEAEATTEETVKSLMAAREAVWAQVYDGSIKRQGLEQSLAAYRAVEHFTPLARALREAYSRLATPDARAEFLRATEESNCDVLGVARWLDASTKGAAPAVEQLFTALRPAYVSTRSAVGTWKSKTNGLGFNFLGWQEPPCDLKAALGDGTEPPPGGWPSLRKSSVLLAAASAPAK